jgi:hypothetical protein
MLLRVAVGYGGVLCDNTLKQRPSRPKHCELKTVDANLPSA